MQVNVQWIEKTLNLSGTKWKNPDLDPQALQLTMNNSLKSDKKINILLTKHGAKVEWQPQPLAKCYHFNAVVWIQSNRFWKFYDCFSSSRMHQGSQQGMNPMGPMGMNPMGPRMPPVSSSGSMMPSQMMRPNGPSINSSESKTNLKIYIL